MTTQLTWEELQTNAGILQRSRTPTGWLVREVSEVCHINSTNNEYITSGYDWRTAMTFVPDPDGIWLKELQQ